MYVCVYMSGYVCLCIYVWLYKSHLFVSVACIARLHMCLCVYVWLCVSVCMKTWSMATLRVIISTLNTWNAPIPQDVALVVPVWPGTTRYTVLPTSPVVYSACLSVRLVSFILCLCVAYEILPCATATWCYIYTSYRLGDRKGIRPVKQTGCSHHRLHHP